MWPHQGRGTSAELVRWGLEFGHGSSEFVVKHGVVSRIGEQSSIREERGSYT